MVLLPLVWSFYFGWWIVLCCSLLIATLAKQLNHKEILHPLRHLVAAALLRNHKRNSVFPPEHNSIRCPGMEICNINNIRVFAVISHVTALLAVLHYLQDRICIQLLVRLFHFLNFLKLLQLLLYCLLTISISKWFYKLVRIHGMWINEW
jgi:hypothetical protein